MKYILTVLCLFQGLSGLLFAQAPEKFTYQSVVRNASGALHANALTGLQIRILQGSATGTEVFKEQHSVTTNANGLLSVLVGNGTAITGSLAGIDWVAGPYFMEAAIDLNGGTNYTLSSAVQLLSVPYSLYAKQSGRAVEAERAKTADNAVRYRAGNGIILRNDSILALEKDARWNAASLQGRPIAGASPATGQVLKWNGSAWAPGNDLLGGGAAQTVAGTGLRLSGDTLFARSTEPLWNAGFLRTRPMDTAAPATNDILQWNGTAWKPAAPATAQINAGPGLSKSGNTLSALTGTALWNAAQLQSFAVSSNTPGRSDVLQWNGSAWTPAALPTAGIVARNGLQKSGDTLDAQSSNAIWNASRLQGNAISSTSPATDDVLKWNGSTWAPGRASGGSSISCSTTSNSNYSVRGTGSGGWECTDAIWITSGKQVGIGTTSPSTSFDLTVGTSGFLVNGTTTTSNILGRLRIGSSSSSSYELQVDGDAYLTSGLRIGTTTSPASGGIMANGMIETNSRFTMNSSTTGTGTTVIRTSSGELRPQSSTVHVKDNIQTLTVDKNKLFALRPVSYNLKPALGGDREIGLVAEEVENQVPDLVIYGPERQWVGNTGIPAVGPDGRELINPDRQVPWSVRYDRLPVYLLEVIKEQDAAIRRLEERLNALEKAATR
jgi:hypothetical protein